MTEASGSINDMTITTSAVDRDQRSSDSIQWTIVQRGLWVGKRDGEFAGMIEALGLDQPSTGQSNVDSFGAMTNCGHDLGHFPSFSAAKNAFND